MKIVILSINLLETIGIFKTFIDFDFEIYPYRDDKPTYLFVSVN